MRIYVASSWKNAHLDQVVARLRADGHDVYDFRDPSLGAGFRWADLYPYAQDEWSAEQLAESLDHPLARRGFESDARALVWCQACVLVLPSGRSSHVEAGWAAGAGKGLVVYSPEPLKPELMYGYAAGVVSSLDDLALELATLVVGHGR